MQRPFLRVGTWNVNSIWTAEAELYDTIDKEDLDVIMLQETRTKTFKIRGRECVTNSLKARPKNNRKGGYFSGGVATIALKKAMMKKDAHNTSEFILVSDLLIEPQPEPIKLVNVYM